MLATLRHRGFALVWFAGLISLLGDRAMLIALEYYVYQQTGSTLAMALAFTAYYLPTLLLGSIAGVFVDRWNRKRVMVVTNLAQTLAMLPLLLVHPGQHTWVVYLVIFIGISMATFFQPAEGAILPHLVPEEYLVPANAMNSLSDNTARLAGPPIGGALVAWLGLGSVAIVDSATFLLAAILISFVSVPTRMSQAVTESVETVDEATSSWVAAWKEWLDGLRLVVTNRAIAGIFVVAVTTSFGGCMFDPLIAPWVRSVLHQNATVLGWISTTGAIGGILGGILLGQFGRGLPPARIFGAGTVLAGLILLAMYNLKVLPLVLILCFAKSIPLVGSGAGLQTLLQRDVPDEYRGRVYGGLGTSNALVGLASLWIAGSLAEAIGIVPVLSLACGITVLAGLLGLVLLTRESPENPARDELAAGEKVSVRTQ
jgi:MFS family permease